MTPNKTKTLHDYRMGFRSW